MQISELTKNLPRPKAPADAVCGAVYAAAVCVLVPLYMPDGYAGLIDAKFRLFALLTLAATLACGAIALRSGARPRLSRPDAQTGALLALLAVWAVSTAMNGFPREALTGLVGRRNGLISLALHAAAFWIVRAAVREESLRARVRAAALAAGAAVAALGWANALLLDPFDAYLAMEPGVAANFLSTIGNINFFGGYLALLAPAALWLCCEDAPPRARALRFGAAALLTSALAPASSDGAWIGFAAACAVLVCLRGFDTRRLARLCGPLAAACAAWMLYGLAARVTSLRVPLRGISAVACHPAAAAACALLCALAALALPRLPRTALCVPMRALVALALAALFVLFALVNVVGVSAGPAEELLRFGPSWGSNRGIAWELLVREYAAADVPHKLLGFGPEGVDRVLNPAHTEELVALTGDTFDSAHNELLQQLVCGGILGAAAWCVFWGAGFARALRRAPWLACALCGYTVQALLSINSLSVSPAAWVFCAL